MLDRHDIDSLEKEFIELSIAEMTDDVTCDIHTLQARSKRIEEIEDEVGKHIVENWAEVAFQEAVKVGYASGAKVEI